MIVGCATEIKNNENRVGLTPAGAWALGQGGHTVLIERSAGLGSGFSDEDYADKGAELVESAAEVWARADMVVKVKEPLPSEYGYFRDDLVLFTYLHLAPVPDLTSALLDSGIIGIAYETVQLADRSLPLLVPMSEVAGRMSMLVGAQYLAYTNGGLGLLASGVPGVAPAEVLVIGGGIVGINAAKMAAGLGARVVILDVSAERMKYLDDVLPANVNTVHSDRSSLEHYLISADLVIGAVLVTGTVAPKLVTREMLHLMKPRSVVVDVAVDQGGCFETTRATTHQDPVYYEEGVLHYAVANMPGAYPRTSTLALTNVTLPYVLDLANKGVTQAIKDDQALALGVNVWHGQLTCKGVGVSQDRACTMVGALM
ncbi:MAG: alanine dehydrogenase [bacterium]